MNYGVEVLVFLFVLLVSYVSSEGNGKGFGDDIEWVTLDDGLKMANERNMPLLLLIHKSWCGACKALKPKFAASDKIKELSSHFVMVNTEDDEEPKGSQYNPDGGYIPRIFFLSPSGEVQTQIKNKYGNPKYGYYYSDPQQIVTSMEETLKLYSVKAADEL